MFHSWKSLLCGTVLCTFVGAAAAGESAATSVESSVSAFWQQPASEGFPGRWSHEVAQVLAGNEGTSPTVAPAGHYEFIHDETLPDGNDSSYGLDPFAALKWTSARPDGHAPIGVMADHVHHKGEFMVSYRYMRMHMEGTRVGTNRIDDLAVRNFGFAVTPTKMTMDMHMLGMMHAVSDNVTLVVMTPFIYNRMNHRGIIAPPAGPMMAGNLGARFTTSSGGIGDISMTAMWKALDWNRQRIQLNAGFSLPTGTIDAFDETPMGRVALPYPMQLGSGTWDLRPGLTYLGETDRISWGAQASGIIRTGSNWNHYRMGHQTDLTSWVAAKWTDWLSTSFRVDGRIAGNYAGADPRLNPTVVYTARPDLRGGERVDLLIGANIYAPKSWGKLHNHRIAIEAGWPVYQRLNGPQLETDWTVTAGWQYSWGGSH